MEPGSQMRALDWESNPWTFVAKANALTTESRSTRPLVCYFLYPVSLKVPQLTDQSFHLKFGSYVSFVFSTMAWTTSVVLLIKLPTSQNKGQKERPMLRKTIHFAEHIQFSVGLESMIVVFATDCPVCGSTGHVYSPWGGITVHSMWKNGANYGFFKDVNTYFFLVNKKNIR